MRLAMCSRYAVMVAALAAAGCAPPAERSASASVATSDRGGEPGLDSAAIQMVIQVERAVVDARARALEVRRARGRALQAGLPMADERMGPIPDAARIAAELGHDPGRYAATRRRIGEIAWHERLAGERQSTERFRRTHLASLERAIASATSDAERAALTATRKTVEAALARDPSPLDPASARLAELLRRHAAELSPLGLWPESSPAGLPSPEGSAAVAAAEPPPEAVETALDPEEAPAPALEEGASAASDGDTAIP